MQSIHVSSNRRFLITADGRPFFWLADTAWELFHRCTLSEVEIYLENRRQKHFNVILAVALAELDGLRDPNPNGDVPFIDLDPGQPNEAYFRHVDAIVAMAAAKGLYIGLLPTWGDKVVQMSWGKGPVVFGPESAYRYGKWIGARYSSADNILWVNGGDRPEPAEGTSYTEVWRALARGVREGVGGHVFMTYHPNGGHGSSETFHDEDWLDMNMWQSGHSRLDAPNWQMITDDYQRIPTKPVLDGEPNYEDHGINPFVRPWDPSRGYFRDHDVRKQAYRAVFAGACGHTYGHHSIWQMFTPGRESVNFPDRSWLEALDRPGAEQIGHLRRLIESRPYLDRIPDQGLLASGEGTGSHHIRATRADDGSYAMIYIPGGWDRIDVNTQLLSSDHIQALWFDPRSGTTSGAGTVEKTKSATIIVPSADDDWVLILQ
ncbi:MAG: glycoside hydrolase family 140 protein [Chloroflexi bacterium]|nr:glycoside hydrolase family 140 protein [Chloroflexota bacterium]